MGKKNKNVNNLDNISTITNFMNASTSGAIVIDAANEYTLSKNRKLLDSLPNTFTMRNRK